MDNKKLTGMVTLPMDNDIKVTRDIIEKWGADAVRDCDGTKINDDIISLGKKIYKTYFVTRGDNEFAKTVEDEWQHIYVCSDRFLATESKLNMPIMQGYLIDQIEPDYNLDIKKYYQVFNKTTNEEVLDYTIDKVNHIISINNALPFNEYLVNFMAKVKWDSTQMYNHITNNWTTEKEIPYDPMYPVTRKYIVDHLNEWLNDNKQISVVRFTTFLYHFALLFNDNKKEKYVNWFGYSTAVSPRAIELFEKEYGIEIKSTDIVDDGYYNSPFRVPTKKFLMYQDFIQKFVASVCKELVDIVHADNREAMMFLGDNWIGAEPYGKYFESIGLDAVVGSVGGGVTVRMLSDIKGVKYVEGRFLPYFFPDTFYEGNQENAVKELNKNWFTARRAIMRKAIDRIGYGGYLGLANKFPNFINRVTEIADEFRNIYNVVKNNTAKSTVKVAILNSWGKLRSWQCYMVAHELYYKQVYSYQGILECLSGMDVDVEFLSFDDILSNGIPKDIDVIINAGQEGTAFSGGEYWNNANLLTTIRKWVYGGGAFIGIGQPTAYLNGGKFFQLDDILGVDQERSFTLSNDKYNVDIKKHFITEGVKLFNLGERVDNIYAKDTAMVLAIENNSVTVAVNDYGKGRGVYISGLPYSAENCSLLRRAIYYSANKIKEYYKFASSNCNVECNFYIEKNMLAIVNNTDKEQVTNIYTAENEFKQYKLLPGQIIWEQQ